MKLTTLVEMTNKFVDSLGVNWNMDVRTVRFYQSSDLVSRPTRGETDAREKVYTIQNFKEIISVKLLQADGFSIKSIKPKIMDPDKVLLEHGFDPKVVESFVETEVQKIENGQGPDEVAVPEPVVTATKTEEAMPKTETPAKTVTSPIAIEITNGPEYETIRDSIKLGGRFVFVSGLSEDAGKKLHRLIHGQKSKAKGSVTKTIVPADVDGFDLPGCTVKGVPISNDMTIITSDKDVYREAEDVATIFIIDPSAANQKIALQVSMDGCQLDTLEAKLDRNGCAAIRYAVVAAGRYTISVPGKTATCSFEAARYVLAPLTATLASFSKSNEKLIVGLSAQSFGQDFNGDAIAVVIHDGQRAEDKDVTFKDGVAKFYFDASKYEGALSILVFPKSDPSMVANVPLPGSRKSEREETEISQLGTVTTVSLMASAGAKQERSLFFVEGAVTNNPIRLKSCISKRVELEFMTDAEDVHVMIDQPSIGSRNTEELGTVKAGKTTRVMEIESTMASVHIAAFIDGKPWEGHAVIVKPSEATVRIDSPKTLKPGETLKLKIKAQAKTSVFVRVADKRMRVHDDAKTSLAAMLKRWIGGITGSLVTGEVSLGAPVIAYSGYTGVAGVYGVQGLAGAGGMAGIVRGAGVRNAMFGARLGDDGTRRMVRAQGLTKGMDVTKGAQPKGLLARNEPEFTMNVNTNIGNRTWDGAQALNFAGPAPEAVYFAAMGAPGAAYCADAEVKTSGGIQLELCSAGATLDWHHAIETPKKAVAREMIVDLIFSGLVEVDREKSLSIKLPDCVGDYDITAFAVNEGDWSEAQHDLAVTKDAYIEPMIPQYAHPEDEITAIAIGVRGPKVKKYNVTIDGKGVGSLAIQEGENVRVSWAAKPGVHEVTMLDEKDNELDKVIRIVECPGEETVLGQETRILKKGESYDLSSDEDALSVKVLPGLEGELKVAVHVCSSFEHYCCEQTSSMIVAACVAAMVGEDSVKEKAYQSIVAGEARLKKMHVKGVGFNSYPGQSMVKEWSTAAARRTANLGAVLSDSMPADVRKAAESIVSMGKDSLKAHGADASKLEGAMEAIYYKNSRASIKKDDIEKVLADMDGGGYYQSKSEASYCAAVLVRDGNLEDGIKVTNAVSKKMAGALSGAMHGSYETLAYMHLVHELQKSDVVPNTGSGKVKVNGKVQSIDQAIGTKDVTNVEATNSAIAVKITRINRIRFDEYKSGVKMEIEVQGKNGSKTLKSGDPLKLIVKNTSGYKSGDVLCVALPECLSRIVAGAKTKKFQIDFAGKNQVEVELVAGAVAKPQRWAAVVRNMYDTARIGSVGLLTAKVE